MSPLLFFSILVLIIGQGLFLLVAIQLVPNKNKKANRILSLILLIVTVMVLGRLTTQYYHFPVSWRVGTFVESSLFIFGPLIYFYVRRLLFTESKLFRLQQIHYVPLAIYMLCFLWSLSISSKVFSEYYQSGKLNLFYKLLELIGMVSVGFYLIKSFLLLRLSKKHQKEQYASESKVSNFVLVLLISLSIFFLIWGLSYVNRNLQPILGQFINYNVMWISLGGLMYVIGFYSLRQPEILRVYKPNKKMSKVNRLNAKKVTLLNQKLEEKLQQEQLFLDPLISLNSLAKAMETTENDLSWLLNNVYKKNFYGLINEYRVKAFVTLIEQDMHRNNTLFELALDVGFNSKSTFNKAFKTIMNQTPSGYVKQFEQN